MSKRRLGQDKRGRVLVVLLALTLFAFITITTGCAGSSADRIGQLNVAVDGYVERSNEIDATIDALVQSVAGLQITLDEALAVGDDLLIAKATAALAEIQSKLQVAKNAKTQVDRLVKGVNAKIDLLLAGGDEITLADELEAYVPVAKTATNFLPPPYNVIGVGVLGALSTFLETKRRINKTALTEVVAGVSKLLAAAPDDAIGAKKLIGSTQTSKTEAMVKDIIVKNGTSDGNHA